MPTGVYKRSNEIIEKMRGRMINNSIKKGKKSWNSGKIGVQEVTLETRKKLSEKMKGSKNVNWKGGISKLNPLIRGSFEYRLWREAVFKRDNYTCIWCGKRGVELNADHIKPFSSYPELRFAIDNGRTLCVDCHKTTDTFKKRNDIYNYFCDQEADKTQEED